MKEKRFLLFVLFIAILISLLPIYPAVHEVRSYMLDGTEELGQELAFGSMADFVEGFKYVHRAWNPNLLPLNIFLAVVNLAICWQIAWYVSLGIRALWQRFKK